jgi:hypothetical protein
MPCFNKESKISPSNSKDSYINDSFFDTSSSGKHGSLYFTPSFMGEYKISQSKPKQPCVSFSQLGSTSTTLPHGGDGGYSTPITHERMMHKKPKNDLSSHVETHHS